MAESLPPHFLDLVADAALKSFWRRRALREFLRRSGIAESFLSSWTEDETKRDLLYRLFPLLERNDKGSSVIKQMAVHLAEQTSFPDLEGWEDSVFKKQQASESVEKLRQYIQKQREEVTSAREREETRKRAQAIREERQRRQHNLTKLSERLDELAKEIGSQNAGYAFQDWFFDLVSYYEVNCRRPYVTDGRQIDGSVTVDGTPISSN